MHSMFKALALAAGLMVPGTALAATSAVVTTDLNVRTGPSASYQRYGTIPAGDQVTVYGCLSGYNWCDIDWAGGRGWVSGNYLAYLGRRYNREPISTVGISIGVPVLGFDPYVYHRRHYAGRSWYRDRYLDRRDDYRDARRDRYEDHRRVDDRRRDDDRPRYRDDRRDRDDRRGGEARRGDEGRRDNDGRRGDEGQRGTETRNEDLERFRASRPLNQEGTRIVREGAQGAGDSRPPRPFIPQ